MELTSLPCCVLLYVVAPATYSAQTLRRVALPHWWAADRTVAPHSPVASASTKMTVLVERGRAQCMVGPCKYATVQCSSRAHPARSRLGIDCALRSAKPPTAAPYNCTGTHTTNPHSPSGRTQPGPPYLPTLLVHQPPAPARIAPAHTAWPRPPPSGLHLRTHTPPRQPTA